MAISSNRSVSPTRTRTNLDAKTPEIGARKSFSGNPLSKPSIVPNRRSFDPSTPANSPAEFSKKISGSLRSSYEHKENEKDQNPKLVRVRSPSVLKGSKNFMAPTISASSKVTPSPRKKVLAERNETVRVSISDFDVIPSMVFDSVPLETQNLKPDQVTSDPQNSSQSLPEIGISESNVDPQNSTQSLPEIGISESNVDIHPKIKPGCPPPSTTLPQLDSDPSLPPEFKTMNLTPKVKSFCASPSNVLAPLDSDPSLPPYDPKTNFLSPRPQFLHYKPKPRIEAYLNKERELLPGEGKRLEESFTSESSSDTEVSSETQSVDSQKESENASSSASEILSGEEEEPHCLEAKADPIDEEIQMEKVPKASLHSRVRSKIIPLLLVLVLACLFFPVIDSPVLAPTVNKHPTFFTLHTSDKLARFATQKFNGLASNVKLWSVQSISYLSELFLIPKEVEEMGLYNFANSTSFNEELLADEHQRTVFGTKGTGIEFEQTDMKFEKGTEAEDEVAKEQTEQVKVEEGEKLVVEEEFIEQSSPLIAQSPDDVVLNADFQGQDNGDSLMIEKVEEEYSPIAQAPSAAISEIVNLFDFQDQESIDSQMNMQPAEVDITPQSPESASPQLSYLEDSLFSEMSNEPSSTEFASLLSEQEELIENVDTEKTLQSTIHELPHKFPVEILLGICSFLTSLAMAAAYFGLKQRKATTVEVVNSVQHQEVAPKKMISKLESVCSDGEHTHQERSSRNWPTEVDMYGESGPSESTSLKESLSYRQRESERASEVQSHERKVRYSKRESLASSSEYSDSASYGSFTTFERIHGKHGCGEDEVVTPVRRSSRIKKLVSP